MFPVLNVHQLATVAAGDICHHEVLHGLLFRVVVIVGAASKANADAPVDLAISAVDIVDHMIGDQDIAIVDGDVPLDRIPLQMAEFTVGDASAIDLIMEALAQNGVVCLAHANVINQQIAHHAGFLAADIDLRYRAKSTHRQAFNHTVRSANVERNVLRAPAAFTDHFAAFLQHKAAASVAG